MAARLLFFTTLIAATIHASAGLGQPAEWQALYEQGVEARREGRLDEAIERLGRAAGIEPGNSDIQVQLGLALSASRRYEEARNAFRKALELAPGYDDARLGLARSFHFEGRFDEAEREIGELLARSPEHAEAKALKEQVSRARDEARAKAEKPAAAPATDAVPAGRSEAERLYRDGVTARRAGRLKAAEELFGKAVRLAPGNADAHLQLGLTLTGLRRYDEARRALERALALAPDYADARLGLARIAFFRNDLADAERAVKTVLARTPDHAGAKALRAHIAAARTAAARPRATGRREAKDQPRPAAPAGSKEDRLLAEAARLRAAQRFADAEALYREVLRRRPRDVDVLVAAGLVTAFQGPTRFLDARRDFARALALAPGSSDARLGLARLSLYESDLAAAERHLAEILRLQPDHPEALSLSARVRLARGEAEAAEAAFRALAARTPRDADLLLGLGDALRAQLRDEEAADAYRQAASIAPASADVAQRLQLRSRPRWRFDVDGFYSALTRGHPPWREVTLRLSHQLTARTVLSAGIEASERFGRRDLLIDTRADHRWSDSLATYLRLGGTPAADFRPAIFAETGGALRVSRGVGSLGATLLTLDIGIARYPTAATMTVSPGLQQYFFGDRLWIAAKLIGVESRSAGSEAPLGPALQGGNSETERMGGFMIRADLQVTERLRIFAGHADAPDFSDGRGFRTRSFFGGAELALDERIGLRLSAAREEREGSYDRTTFSIGATARF